MRTTTLVSALSLLLLSGVQACTNLLVSRGASTDDSNIIAYNAGVLKAVCHDDTSHLPDQMI
jgi:hypothetical protein